MTSICEGRNSNKQLIKSAHIFEKEPVSATKGSELCSQYKSSFVLSQSQTQYVCLFSYPEIPLGWERLVFHIGPGEILKHYLCKIMKLGTWVPRTEVAVVRREWGPQNSSARGPALLMAKFLNSHTNLAPRWSSGFFLVLDI